MGIRISKDHLHPSVIESITSLIGDLNQLETTAKGNAVEAINELLATIEGGEDTTLRDLLASILENKGVDVTEEDDMASLISKVSLFDDYTPSPLYIVNNGVVNTDFKIIKQSSGYSMTQNSDHILFNIPKGTSNNSMAISTPTKFNLTNYSNIVIRYYASGGRFNLGINTEQSNSNYNNYVQWLGENQVNQEATYRFNISNYNDEYYIIIDVDNLSASVTSTLKIYDIYLEK